MKKLTRLPVIAVLGLLLGLVLNLEDRTAPKQQHKSFWQALWDFIGIPFRLVIMDQAWLPKFHWTTLEDERLNVVLPHIKGRLLDVGSGENTLVRRYEGEGIGVDVFDWGHGTVVVDDSADLPFEDASFDSVTYVACLNHIPYRDDALKEARRLISDDGTLIITMIDPVLGDIGHAIWWYSEDKVRGGMIEGEVGGMWNREIIALCEDAGFELDAHYRFVYGMNNLLIFRPAAQV